jgi:hypothetical protein
MRSDGIIFDLRKEGISDIYYNNSGTWVKISTDLTDYVQRYGETSVAMPSDNNNTNLASTSWNGAEPVLIGSAGQFFVITEISFKNASNFAAIGICACFIVNASPPTETRPRMIAYTRKVQIDAGNTNTTIALPTVFAQVFEGGVYVMPMINALVDTLSLRVQTGLPSVNRRFGETTSINPAVMREAISWTTLTNRPAITFKYRRII